MLRVGLRKDQSEVPGTERCPEIAGKRRHDAIRLHLEKLAVVRGYEVIASGIERSEELSSRGHRVLGHLLKVRAAANAEDRIMSKQAKATVGAIAPLSERVDRRNC